MKTNTYEQNERKILMSQLIEITKIPVLERTKNKAEYLETLKNDTNLLTQRVGWLLDGNYGRGSYLVAGEIANNYRCNRPANLAILVAQLEWQITPSQARHAFSQLSEGRKEEVTEAINETIESHLETEK